MAITVGDALLKMGLDTSDFDKDLKKSVAGIKDLTKPIGLALTGMGAGIFSALSLATKSALDEEIGINRLSIALKNAGASYAGLKDEIEGAIDATQRKTNYGDEEQRDALVALVGITGTYTGALQQLQIATDLAAAKNMSLESAAMLVGRAATGNTQLLSRYGIQVREGASATEVLAMMQERFAGAAQGAVNPLVQFKNQIGDLVQDVGKSLVPVLRDVVADIIPIVSQVRDWIKANPELARGLTLATLAGSALIGFVIGPLLVALPTLVNGFIAAKNAVLALRISTIEYTLIALAAVAGVYALISFIRSLKGEAYVGTSFGDTVFGQIKQDIGDLMKKLGGLLPSTGPVIDEFTGQAQRDFDAMAGGVSGATGKLQEFEDQAKKVRDEQRELALSFVDLWNRLTYSETAAGKLNLTMGDVYTALYKLGFGVDTIGAIFEKWQNRTDSVGAVLQEFGLTAEQVATLIGKLTEKTDKQTDALNRQADAAMRAAQATVALTPGLYLTPWGVIVAYGERALGPGGQEYIGGQGLTGKIFQMAQGGMIKEPTLLSRLSDLKPYAIAGEAGPERVSPMGAGYQTADIRVYFEGQQLVELLGQRLVNIIRLRTGVKI